MRALLVATCFWPGLPRLWLRGSWWSLSAAVAFGAAINLVLVSSFVWPELLPPPVMTVGWLLVAGIAVLSALRSYRLIPDLLSTERVDDRGLFIQAQGEYLQGHWFEAESILQRLLRRSPRDADACLMLATLYRHTRRHEDATLSLERLERLEGADRWRWEIARERQLNEESVRSAAEEGRSLEDTQSGDPETGPTKAAS